MDTVQNWKEEKRSAYLYRGIAAFEKNPVHKTLFLNLAEMADRQATLWEKQSTVSFSKNYSPDMRARVIVMTVRLLGARISRSILAAAKIRGMSIYQHSMTEQRHPDHSEHSHRSHASTNTLRAAIFGMHDGLLSNTSLVLGMSGAAVGLHTVFLAGVTGLLAGAFSMAAGEYISVRSQRDMLEYQLKLEKEELDLYPEEEAAELALIYEARGIPAADAKKQADALVQDPHHALQTLAREELGINMHDMVSPISAALSSFFSFALGAFIPLLPWLTERPSLTLSLVFTGLSLFCVGAAVSLFSERNALWGGLRILLIGSLAGTATYIIGSIFNATIVS